MAAWLHHKCVARPNMEVCRTGNMYPTLLLHTAFIRQACAPIRHSRHVLIKTPVHNFHNVHTASPVSAEPTELRVKHANILGVVSTGPLHSCFVC